MEKLSDSAALFVEIANLVRRVKKLEEARQVYTLSKEEADAEIAFFERELDLTNKIIDKLLRDVARHASDAVRLDVALQSTKQWRLETYGDDSTYN